MYDKASDDIDSEHLGTGRLYGQFRDTQESEGPAPAPETVECYRCGRQNDV